jgi:hypothetical protein
MSDEEKNDLLYIKYNITLHEEKTGITEFSVIYSLEQCFIWSKFKQHKFTLGGFWTVHYQFFLEPSLLALMPRVYKLISAIRHF